MIALFIVGPPGSGKSSLAKSIIKDKPFETIADPKWTVGSNWCAVGHYNLAEKFPGGDTVHYGQGQNTFNYWAQNLSNKELTIIEGNRFASSKYPITLEKFGRQIICVHVDAPEEILFRRRVERGSKTNPKWMAGRRTMARNFANFCGTETKGGKILWLDGPKPIETLRTQVVIMLDAVNFSLDK